MPYRYAEFQAGEYYHVYHRGGDQQKIFFENENYLYFLRLLKKYRDKFAMNVVAYCLMPNHFHFMLQPQRSGTLSQFMGKLQQSYVMAINKRYQRSGSLFYERFRHVHVHSERYQILLRRFCCEIWY
jgi:REP element-mobilizing transposase RayT